MEVKAYLIKVGVPEFEDQDTFFSVYLRNLSSCLEKAPTTTVKQGINLHVYQSLLGHKVLYTPLRGFV